MISVFLLILFEWRHCEGYGFYGGPSMRLPEPNDLIEAHNLTSWITNHTARAMLMQYLVLCPEQDMCHGNNLRRNYVFDIGMTRSCQPCDCDASCFRKSSCCPSKSLRFENGSDFTEPLEQNKTMSLRCTLPVLTMDYDFHGTSYWMIESCPNGKVCTPPNSQSRNISLLTPVTSLTTKETYRYLQCALCNNENISDLLFWKRNQIVCTTRSDLISTMLHTSDVVYQKLFDGPPTCNILFYPPKTIKDIVAPCISATAVPCTAMESLDGNTSYLIQACDSYYIPFITNYITFKNVFCALCTGMPLLSLPIENKKPSGYSWPNQFPHFSALIDFSKERSVDEFHTDVECANGRMFNKQLSACYSMTCEREYKYIHHPPEPPSCQSLFSSWGENNYEINLIFERSSSYNSTAFILFGPLLVTHLEKKLLTNNLSDYLCCLHIFSLDDTGTDQFGALIELTVNSVHSLNEMMQYMLNVFANGEQTVLEENFLGINVTFTSFLIGQRFILYEEDRSLSLSSRHYVHPLSYQTKLPIGLINMVPTRNYCLKGQSTVVVADWFSCPKVRITTEDTLISLKNFSLCLPELNTCIPSRYFKKSANNLEYEICVDWFNPAPVTASTADIEASQYLSLVCLSLSTAGSVLTIISYIVRSNPLNSPGSHIVILSLFITFANIVYSVSRYFQWNEYACVTAGVFVHFLWLSSVFWMSLSSFKIFQTFTNIATFRKKSKVSVLLLVNFVFCLFFIGVNISVSYYSSGSKSFGYSSLTCYIADPIMILYTFALPVGISVSINTFMFFVTANRIYQKEDMRKSRDQKRVSAYFRLSTLTGVSWCFGFLAQITNLEVFSFLHTVFSGGQGVFLYLAFGMPLWVNCKPRNYQN